MRVVVEEREGEGGVGVSVGAMVGGLVCGEGWEMRECEWVFAGANGEVKGVTGVQHACVCLDPAFKGLNSKLRSVFQPSSSLLAFTCTKALTGRL